MRTLLILTSLLLICGSIRCALAMKIGGEAKAHELYKAHKWFGEIPLGQRDIKIKNILNGVPKSKLRRIKRLMGINIKLGEKVLNDMDQAKSNLIDQGLNLSR